MVAVSILVGVLGLVAGFVAGWLVASRTQASARGQAEQAMCAVFRALAAEQLYTTLLDDGDLTFEI